jgi:hypothetical protein
MISLGGGAVPPGRGFLRGLWRGFGAGGLDALQLFVGLEVRALETGLTL